MVGNRICFWIALLYVTIFSQFSAQAENAKPGTYKNPIRIRVSGEIGGFFYSSVKQRLKEAKDMDADLIIFEIDSPGGRADYSFELAEELVQIDWARTVAYIPKDAISGGAVISLGCDDIIMHPDGQIGDIGVIFFGADGAFRYAPEKVASKIANDLRIIAEKKGRPPAVAEAMVIKELKIFNATNLKTGEKTILSEHEWKSLPNPEDWEKNEQAVGKIDNHFLTVTGKEAVKIYIAKQTVDDFDGFKEVYGLTADQNITTLEATWVDDVVYVLNWNFITFLLLIIGICGLFVEFSAPGMGVGGLVSVLCFSLFFWSRFAGGTAGWLEVILALVGVGCIAAELFVFPGFGIPGLMGILLVGLSFVMASQTFIIPETDIQWTEFMKNIVIFLGTIVAVALFLFVLTSMNIKVFKFNSAFILTPDASGASAASFTEESVSDQEDVPELVGSIGTSVSMLRPTGKAKINDKVMEVVTDGTFIEANQEVEVIKVTGNRVMVKLIAPENNTEAEAAEA